MSIIDYLKENGFNNEAVILEKAASNSIRISTAKAKEEDFSLGESKILVNVGLSFSVGKVMSVG